MRSLLNEIELYHNLSRLAESTKTIYRKRLKDFAIQLAELTHSPIEELHLEKMYDITDVSGTHLFYKEIDIKIIDCFFFNNIEKSYNWLQNSKHALQSFFLYLYRNYDFFNIMDHITFSLDKYKDKPMKKKMYYLTRHDVLKLMHSVLENSTNLERDSLLFILLISTGSRQSEILNVKVNEIDIENETIYRKQTKNKSSNYIPLRDGLGVSIKKFIEMNNLKDNDYLFMSNGSKIDGNELRKLFNYFLEKANLPDSTPHQLRHNFATVLAENGMDIITIQQLLNHDKNSTTQNYISPNYIRNINVEITENKKVYKHIRKNL
ncbi:hypothetical protein CR203_23430 [Salipaludibacillus neizhouensis]|uniref:Tyr recombinase domain-containing protein n=1 Tax=Salipaludibacillus neizhouensis TaxID=885475 RepID=A0A3A9K5K3_9BACI|nr:tyrosine-type recombinase/integrase [Salipaludibacillus neizhouensis]RKL64963.1 hypothetical protein CR203_23430 [Salipaludibacillus neizhouensis]